MTGTCKYEGRPDLAVRTACQMIRLATPQIHARFATSRYAIP